ncbi:hypothetical protein WJX77_005095 [Trebouxia sp. C0004]
MLQDRVSATPSETQAPRTSGRKRDASPIWPGFVLGPRCLTTSKHRPAVLRITPMKIGPIQVLLARLPTASCLLHLTQRLSGTKD